MTTSGKLPQRVVFGVALAILAFVIGATAWQWVSGSSLPALVSATTVGISKAQDGSWHVEAAIVNVGEDTAQDVHVLAELTLEDGTVQESEQTVDFLSGGERHLLVFVFSSDPAEGALDVRVGSYTVP